MRRRAIWWVTASGLLRAVSAFAQVSADLAVEVSATVQKTPVPKITLVWPSNSQATGYTIYRKQFSDTSWGNPVGNLAGTATGYSDTNVTVGATYEYQVARQGALEVLVTSLPGLRFLSSNSAER